MLDVDATRDAIDELGAMLRADGADLILLVADPGTDRVEVQLDLDGASCADCVLPPDELRSVISQSLTRRVAGEFELIVHDPRRAP